jgi:hypothetical protein
LRLPVGTVGSSVDKFVGKTLPGGHHILDLISVGGMGRVPRATERARAPLPSRLSIRTSCRTKTGASLHD